MTRSTTPARDPAARAGREPTVALLADADRVVEVLTPLRRRLLGLLGEPDSATGLARRIGSSRQRINYHLRALEDAGLLEVVEVRARRGASERFLRRRTDVVWVDPASFDPAGLADRDRVGLTGVLVTTAELMRQAVRIGTTAGTRRVAAATLDAEVRLADPAALRALLDDLAVVVASHDTPEAGLAMRVTTTLLPSDDAGADSGTDTGTGTGTGTGSGRGSDPGTDVDVGVGVADDDGRGPT